MDKKQYNNIIDYTLKHDKSAQTDDSLATARAVFKNMGVALPQGDIKEVFETIKSGNYMSWRACSMKEAQAAADQGIAAIGISDKRILVLSANDEEQPITKTTSVMSISEDTSALEVDGLKYFSYGRGRCGGGCGSNPNVGNYNDRYTYELVNTFGFSCEVANLIRCLYSRVDNIFCSETQLQRAWKCARILSEFVYDNNSTINKWDDVAGSVTDINNRQSYFVNTLGYTNQKTQGDGSLVLTK